MVDHLFAWSRPTKFGPWYCDACGRGFTGIIHSEDHIEVEMTDDFQVKTVNLLVLEPQEKPVYFVVEGWGLRSVEGRKSEPNLQYLYEEHSCPTNFIRCEAIISEGDTDPHGLFRYVETVDRPKILDEAHQSDDSWPKIFPQAFEDDEA